MLSDAKIVAHDGKDPEKFGELDFDQESIDLRRLSVTEQLYKRWKKAARDGDEGQVKATIKPQHLWFKARSLHAYELRDGYPPKKRDRPEHLREVYLSIDLKFFLERFQKHIFSDYRLDMAPLGDLKREMVKLLRRDNE